MADRINEIAQDMVEMGLVSEEDLMEVVSNKEKLEMLYDVAAEADCVSLPVLRELENMVEVAC